ncbi:hypothetical protein [Marivita geojedonensis]|uniref:Uncharacterized protein n=1 Tax=Marivita geojedonensis TaxID=1123756 RepID=A0A1X4NDN1_9RHOB|nr:hypothetical protein [Marivita geojedonensis]OSQ44942.1 hypothetical protein MGEO_18545 [Marivita geojedonensis]PRY73842.1 hypothetical protein CLV76_12721 [Marivita geojedonensis]
MNAQRDFTTAFQDEIPNYRAVTDGISSLGIRSTRVRVANPRSEWVKELEERFDVLTSLRRGWDGYTGVPVSFTCAQFAANLIERLYNRSLPAPQLVPMANGTMRLEWHMNEFDVEVDVLGPYDVVAYRADLLNDTEEEIEIQTDFTELSEWITELATERLEIQVQAGG